MQDSDWFYAGRPSIRRLIHERVRSSFLLRGAPTAAGTHKASYQMGTTETPPGHKPDILAPFSADMMN